MGVPLRRRGYRDAYKFVMHYNNITWLQRTGSSTEIFYFLNWAVHIIGYVGKFARDYRPFLELVKD